MAEKKDKLYTATFTMPNGKRKYVRAKTQAELERKVQTLKMEMGAGVDISDDTNVSEFTRVWLAAYKKPYLKENSYNTLTDTLNSYILPVIGQLKMRDVKPMHIQQVMTGISEYSRSIQSKTLTAMRSIFNTAVDNNVILRSPVTSNIKARGAVAEEVQTLTAQQCNTLIRAVKGTRAEVLIALLLGGGLRREEACGLKWSDFQYNSAGQPMTGAVSINRANIFLRGNDHVITTELKSRAAYRSVPLMGWAMDILDDAYENRTSEYVLCCKNGEPLTPSAFASIWDIIKVRTARTPEEVGTADSRHPNVVRTIDFHVHPHQLRHTYITYLFENHFDLREVQYFAGHSTPEMTLRVYTHYNEVERLRDSTERVNYMDPFGPTGR